MPVTRYPPAQISACATNPPEAEAPDSGNDVQALGMNLPAASGRGIKAD